MPSIREYRNHIAGTACAPLAGRYIERRNPATGEVVALWPDSAAEDVDQAVAAAVESYRDRRWAGLSGSQRSEVLRAVAQHLKTAYHELALIESQETGKVLTQAQEEIQWAGDIWDYTAGLARAVHGDTYSTLGDSRLGLVLKEPLGPVGMITPWNYPLVVLSQKLPYALAAGCSVVIKPSEMTSGTTFEIVRLLESFGLPPGVVNVVSGYGEPVGRRIAEHTELRLVSFTGSTATARKVVEASTSNMKKAVLELGGKNPNVVFADAHFDAAVDGAVKGFVYNAGAECCSGSRVFVERPIAEAFVKALCAKLAAVKVGDPLEPGMTMGAIINEVQYDKIRRYVDEGKRTATLAFGGAQLKTLGGLFMEPAVFTDVPSGSLLARDEIFGPVIIVVPFDGVEEAIELANDTEYGLAASVWTSSLDTALTMGRRIQSGMVWINTFLDVPSEMPIGGTRLSGYGREHGRAGLDEYLTVKSIVIQDPRQSAPYVPT